MAWRGLGLGAGYASERARKSGIRLWTRTSRWYTVCSINLLTALDTNTFHVTKKLRIMTNLAPLRPLE
jgi:hypothetical protein